VARITRAAIIQASNALPESDDLAAVKKAMIEKHVGLIQEAADKGANVCCLQEIFYGPYFCAEQDKRWYELAEPIPDGPTIKLMQDLAKKHKMVMIVPIYEVDMTGVYYNTAAVIDENGNYLGKYRKHHIPQVNPGFWEKFYFKPGNGGYPVFQTTYGKIGVYICYDRHFPEGARMLGLNGAEIVFTPFFEDAHPDHRAVTRIVEDARFDAKLTNIDLPGEPIYPRWLFYYYATHLRWVANPNFCIDVTGFEDVKKRSIVAYHTQFVLPEKNRKALEWVEAAATYFGSRIGTDAGEPMYTKEPIGLTSLDALPMG